MAINIPQSSSLGNSNIIEINMDNTKHKFQNSSWEFWIKITNFDTSYSNAIISNTNNLSFHKEGYINREQFSHIGVRSNDDGSTYNRKIDLYQMEGEFLM